MLSYRKAQEVALLAPDTKVVTVADREGDLYDLYYEASTNEQQTSAYWLIRAMVNRRLLDCNDNIESLKLIEKVKNKEPVGIIEFELPTINKNERRSAMNRFAIKFEDRMPA